MTARVPGVLIALLMLPTASHDVAAQARSAASGRYVHELWTVEAGLPVNSIRQLQSRSSYIWVATLDGLVRFDGVRMTVYNTARSPDLPNNRFVALHEARDGTLWLQTELNRLVRFRDGHFTHFDASRGLTGEVHRIEEDTTGVVWVATTAGLGRIDGDRFVLVADEIGSEFLRPVRRKDGSVWIAQTRGVVRLRDGRMDPVEIDPDSATITAIAEDPDGRIWIGTSAGIRVEKEDGAFRALPSDDEPITSIHSFVFEPDGVVRAFSSDSIYRIQNDRAVSLGLPGAYGPPVRDASGMLWWRRRMELYNDAGLAWSPEPDEMWVMTALMADREGSIWFGTWNAGVHRLKPALFQTYSEAEGLPHRNSYTVHADATGTIWVGTIGGLSRITRDGAVSAWSQLPGRSVAVYSLHSDRPDRLWVGTGAGLLTCRLPDVTCELEPSAAVPAAHIAALFGDSQGRVWLGSGNAVAVLEDGRWRELAGPLFGVRAFAETRDGAIWMGTNGYGLIRWDGRAFQTVREPDGLPNDFVRALHVDADGWLWVGTEGRGLARLDPRAWGDASDPATRSIVHIGVEHGLYDGGIHQILEDDADRVWMSTNRGIFWVNRSELLAVAEGRAATLHSTHYTERDGMRNREANGGAQPAGTVGPDGRLWFPTQDGVVVIDPARVAPRLAGLPVLIERVVAGDSAFSAADVLELGVDQRDVAIDYTAPSFLEPLNVRFRYRLDPYDRDWVDAGSRRTAFYTRLPPGRYRFRVAASTHGEIWSELDAPLTLRLAPRFHETAAARVLAVVMLALVIGGGLQWRLRNLRRRSRELERVVAERTAALRENERQLAARNAQLAELDEAKSRFFANVSHELRTPLTLTIGPLEDLQTNLDGHDGAARRSVELALRNSRRLLRLVNQILDVARLEAAHMTLQPQPLDLAAFTRGIASAFASIAEQRGILLAIEAPDTLASEFDADAIEKILANLLSNAIKFTPDGGRVDVQLHASNGAVHLYVRDTGPGIAPEHLPHVFERFYRVDETNTRAQPGTGIGLALVRELARLHGGDVAVESGGMKGGATFVVTLPLRPAAGTIGDVVPPAFRVADHIDAGAGPPAAEPEPGDDVPTLLVVDDSADMRSYVRDHFAGRMRVLEAADGESALSLARSQLPDAIVSDVMMPAMDGHELVRRLRASPETDFIPIILLTAKAAAEHRIEGFERGADDYIAKPFDMRELAARVDNLIASRRRLRERFADNGPLVRVPALQGVGARDRAFVERVRAAIDGHAADPDFGVAELAKTVFQDRSHLYRRVQELFGESPSELLRRARLERAAQILAGGDATVAEVAYAAGFHSVSYFTRAFQQRYCMTPAAWRRRSPDA